MAQAGRAVIDRQGKADAGASGVDLDALFPLPGKGKCALTHHPQAGGGTACGSRALDQGVPPDAHTASWRDCWYGNSPLSGKSGTAIFQLSDGAALSHFDFVG